MTFIYQTKVQQRLRIAGLQRNDFEVPPTDTSARTQTHTFSRETSPPWIILYN
eukprot:NODE_17246_length_179_cov_0.784615_g16631_i0.p1 GENE.NODE_17246_length_179_cov_0.784615_g16631_i0~~NODE_17246_length_179_cov_0.784615_g16631_i0.p1  ORF type:complete len:53 (-),score=4.55 NODE_17246_length_179_cov_0.784615_g16631_i0:13-171(-)